jgi:hypothetical protein
MYRVPCTSGFRGGRPGSGPPYWETRKKSTLRSNTIISPAPRIGRVVYTVYGASPPPTERKIYDQERVVHSASTPPPPTERKICGPAPPIEKSWIRPCPVDCTYHSG